MDADPFISDCGTRAQSSLRLLRSQFLARQLARFCALTTAILPLVAGTASADPLPPAATPNQPIELPRQIDPQDQALVGDGVQQPGPQDAITTDGQTDATVDGHLEAGTSAGLQNGTPSESQSHAGADDTNPGPTVPPAQRMGDSPTRRWQRNATSNSVTNEGGGLLTPWYRTQLGALAIVLAAIALCFWALRRWAPTLRIQSLGAIRVVARAPIGPRQAIAVVQLGRRFLVVGVSPGRVDKLCNVDDPREAAELAALLGADWAGSTTRFTTALEDETADFEEGGESAVLPAGRLSERSLRPKPVADLLDRLKRLQRSA